MSTHVSTNGQVTGRGGSAGRPMTGERGGREYWRSVLAEGGFAALPRWTSSPVLGVAEHDTPIPAELMAGLRELTDELCLPLSAVFLTAHAKVLAALSGEPVVTTGYLVASAARPLPCRLPVRPGPWRALMRQTSLVEEQVWRHQDVPVAGLAVELGVTEPRYEVEFDAGRGSAVSGGGLGATSIGAEELSERTVLRVGAARRHGRLVLRLLYRTDALDSAAAARIGGYHLRALELIVADPTAEHDRQSLLSPDELDFQLNGLAGGSSELPDRRAHELFERQARACPDRVAAVQGARQWTYRELNTRANQLARALLARGLPAEGVVGVVIERNLDWLASVLGVFKAGGVYLPIEPHFPAERIATILTRADCALVLTERTSAANLDAALATRPGTRRLLVETAYQEGHPDGDPGIEVGADQLAYIYFTSGSTGAPKGAMCEHAGMLNHLFAKIGDLRIGERQVVAQTAPQCFDISLWQLLSALLVGGRTLLIEQEVVLDAARFVDAVADGRVNVLQVVPSYLEAILSHLERHPRRLPDLRYVSVTGEALKAELARRWFAAMPGVRLVNAYGLTETSDDTNHEIMERPPDGDRVSLGRPVHNVRVYVVDEQLRPVPLGAPGLIVFSGVCVGRGYVNDPERTASAYLTDPYRPGERLYLSGDYGRWRPDGKLEFLGRRDSQVKVSGFRIELGEVEDALLRTPGVRDGAVVAARRGQREKRLMAFYTGEHAPAPDAVRERLSTVLPDYMLPASFHWRSRLPLTPNSKIDRKALTAVAEELELFEGSYDPPATPTERRMAQAWASALGLPIDEIGRRDHFFDRGGTSLSAVKLAVALDRAVSLKDITEHPVLLELAALADGRATPPANQPPTSTSS